VGLIYTGEGKGAAKGKGEKRFDYFQRRLPYICEKKKIKTITDAQAELDELVAFYNVVGFIRKGERYLLRGGIKP